MYLYRKFLRTWKLTNNIFVVGMVSPCKTHYGNFQMSFICIGYSNYIYCRLSNFWYIINSITCSIYNFVVTKKGNSVWTHSTSPLVKHRHGEAGTSIRNKELRAVSLYSIISETDLFIYIFLFFFFGLNETVLNDSVSV